MFKIDSILKTEHSGELLVSDLLIVLGCALALGVVVSLSYMFVNRKERFSRGLAFTLIMLPMITSTIILLTNTMVTAFSIAGAFSIIRFRSTQGNPKDLAFIFTTLALGLACGKGYILAAVLLVVFVVATVVVLSLIGFATPKIPAKRLKITIPENLNFDGVFDEIFAKYLKSARLEKVKSSNFGTMFELTYEIRMKNGVGTKEFLDELRTLNGNLNISIGNTAVDPEFAE